MSPETDLQPVSIGGLSQYLKALVEEDPQLARLWLVGEVTSANAHAKGLFFTLRDCEGSDTLNCVAWNSAGNPLHHRPQPGDQVLVLGGVRLWTGRSQYQFTVVQCLEAGQGLQALRRRQLEQRLAAEGLFAPERKRPLPCYPRILAVVTSASAAAWGDIRRTLQQRDPSLRVLLSPATVQGAEAPRSIAIALERVVADGRAELVILSRGGGAREDLDCFDDERVVRAIATCPIPVIAGIGHQRDSTLADRVADAQVHTPTAAAELAVPRLIDLQAQQSQRRQRLRVILRQRLDREQRQLQQLRQGLHWPLLRQRLRQEQHLLESLGDRLRGTVRDRLQREQDRLGGLRSLAQALDPEAVLQRGYALVRRQGQLVRHVADLQTGDRLQLQLGDGRCDVIVDTTETRPDA